jgi:hypothetical protein
MVTDLLNLKSGDESCGASHARAERPAAMHDMVNHHHAHASLFRERPLSAIDAIALRDDAGNCFVVVQKTGHERSSPLICDHGQHAQEQKTRSATGMVSMSVTNRLLNRCTPPSVPHTMATASAAASGALQVEQNISQTA